MHGAFPAQPNPGLRYTITTQLCHKNTFGSSWESTRTLLISSVIFTACVTTRLQITSFFIAVIEKWWQFGPRFPLFKRNFEKCTSSTHTLRRLLIFSERKFLLSRKSRGRIWTCRVLADFDPYVNKTLQKFIVCDPGPRYLPLSVR